MRWLTWWQILIALHAHSLAQGMVPTICDDIYCTCDSFTRVICNCTRTYEVTLRPDGVFRVPATASAIIVDRCERVLFLPDTTSKLIHLRNIDIMNCNNVVIKERALAWSPFSRESENNPGLRIRIRNSTIKEISSHAIQGRVNEIIISDSTITNLKPFAFSSLIGVKNVELSDNIYDNIEIQPFKKFTTLNFMFRGGVMGTLPSRFLSNIEATNLFLMEGITVNTINSLSFLVTSPKRVVIENNVIDTLQGDGFHIVTRGPITFRNNTVNNVAKGAFHGLSVDWDVVSVMGRQELLIDNNTLGKVVPSALIYNSSTLILRIDGLNLNQSCTCELAEDWKEIMSAQGGTFACWYELENYFVSLPTYVASRCGEFKQTFWIYVVIGIVLVGIVAAVIIIIIVRKENEKKKKKVQIVMPDGKTYRETEVHIIVERAELLSTDF